MQVETLEARDCPALVYGYEPDYLRSLGFSSPENVSVTNITWRQDATGAPVTDGPDTVFAGGVGDGPRVVVINGAARPLTGGEGALTTEREPDVLASFFVSGYDPETYRGGLRVQAKLLDTNFAADGQQLLVSPVLDGAGSVVTEIDAGDTSGGRPSLLFGDVWRGSFDVKIWDLTGDGAQDVIALAGTNGAPRIVVRDGLTGAEVSSFFAGPDADRQTAEWHYTLAAVGVQTHPGGDPTGILVRLPDGGTRFFGLDGTLVAETTP